MKILKDKILEEGQAIGTDIVKVDYFLNHQLDVSFLKEIGKEFAKRMEGVKVDKILTVEASGIAIAVVTAEAMGIERAVFAKKTNPNTMKGECYTADAKSFTKGTTSTLRVGKEFLNAGENIFIVDDFLARGQAALALVEIVRNAGANVVGMGAVIEKEYQKGSQLLREKNVDVHSLCVIEKIEDGVITFK